MPQVPPLAWTPFPSGPHTFWRPNRSGQAQATAFGRAGRCSMSRGWILRLLAWSCHKVPGINVFSKCFCLPHDDHMFRIYQMSSICSLATSTEGNPYTWRYMHRSPTAAHDWQGSQRSCIMVNFLLWKCFFSPLPDEDVS